MNQVWLSLMPPRQNCAVPVLPATSYPARRAPEPCPAAIDRVPHPAPHFLELLRGQTLFEEVGPHFDRFLPYDRAVGRDDFVNQASNSCRRWPPRQ